LPTQSVWDEKPIDETNSAVEAPQKSNVTNRKRIQPNKSLGD
jgi:hypothetical protein